MKKIILRAQGIKKFYGREKVLNIKDFSIYEGSLNLLLGTNGSGKTSLLKILSLIDEPCGGKIWYRERLVDAQQTELLSLRRKFSVVWQNPYLYSGSVTYNIGMPLQLRGESNSQILKKVAHLADQLAISHLLKKDSRELSAGEKQKVSIARALIIRPELLFIDEPTTNLDYESNHFYNDYFRQLVLQGVTILLVTHDLYQIKTLAEYITILKQGQVINHSSADQLTDIVF